MGSNMITIHVEDVTEAKHRKVLNELLAGGFSYEARGDQVDADTFELEWGAGEYAVVRDELLEKKKKNLVKDYSEGYREVYNTLPSSVSVEGGDSVTVSMEG